MAFYQRNSSLYFYSVVEKKSKENFKIKNNFVYKKINKRTLFRKKNIRYEYPRTWKRRGKES